MQGGVDYKSEAATALVRVKQLLEEPGWVEFEHKGGKDVKAQKKTLPGKSVEIVRSDGLVEGVAPAVLCDWVMNQSFDDKKKSDASMQADEVVEEVGDVRIVYQAYSAPWPVSGRDLLLNRSRVVEGNVYWHVDVSTKHAKKPDPQGSYVRADLIGAYRYAPHEKGTFVTYVVFMDPMGNIPSFLVNGQMGKVPARVEGFRQLKK
jgi:hypothetical protein